MDQPINLPSQFISLRCRGVEIQIFLSRSPEIMRNVQSFIPPPPRDPFDRPMQNKNNQIKANN
ncbi:hypothetical protein V8C40DRAFT_278742 [Trichoderma camerunense]